MKLDPFTFYDEAEVGDYVEIEHADGDRRQLLVEGVMFRAGDVPVVDVISTRGTRFALRHGDRVEIVARSGRRGYLE